MRRPNSSIFRPPGTRGAVLLIVLMTMMFATAALVYFIDRSTPDLLVEKREASARWLRQDAQSALEASLAVLSVYRQVLGELHHPSEGWGDPLPLSGFVPSSGRKVVVRVSDESGRIPLVNTDYAKLAAIFSQWGMVERDAERCADALLSWTKSGYVPKNLIGSEEEEYKRGAVPYRSPQRPLRSYDELAAIVLVRDQFFDEQGVPNEWARRFAETFSLLDYPAPNLNAAVPEVLVDPTGLKDQGRMERLQQYRGGEGAWRGRGRGFFRDQAEAVAVLGPTADGSSYDLTVKALRVEVTVSEGESHFRLKAIVAPPGGARWPSYTLSPPEGRATQEPAETASTPAETSEPATDQKVNYPFEVLEIVENDGISLPREVAAALSSP